VLRCLLGGVLRDISLPFDHARKLAWSKKPAQTLLTGFEGQRAADLYSPRLRRTEVVNWELKTENFKLAGAGGVFLRVGRCEGHDGLAIK
jgi:hypothetical protein